MVVEFHGMDTLVDAFPFILLADARGDPGAGIGIGGILHVGGRSGRRTSGRVVICERGEDSVGGCR